MVDPIKCKLALVAALVCLTVTRGGSQPPPNNAPLRGYADLHNHQFSYLAFGGNHIVGEAYGPIDRALSHLDFSKHGRLHAGDTLGGFISGNPFRFYETQGYPSFSGWPQFWQTTHQAAYEDWLFRAVEGGLRLMVMFAEDAPVLCKWSANDGRNCDDEVTTINKQLDAAYAMQEYLDHKAGGSGLGWYRIVTTPAQARTVIRQGKLAVILGVETNNLFNCQVFIKGEFQWTCPGWEDKLDGYFRRGGTTLLHYSSGE